MYRTIFFLVFALTIPFVYGQTTLQYNLKKGEVFTIKQEAVQQITQDIEGNKHEITNSIEGVLEFKVVGIHKDTYNLDVTFKDLQLYMYSSSEGELLDINASEISAGDMQSRIFNSLLNVPIHIVLDRSGKVLRVSGGDSLISRMAAASGVEDTFTLELMKESLAGDFGSEALSNSYEQMTFIYPKVQIKTGESWENEYIGKISSRNRWTLNNLDRGRATIRGNASVVMDLYDSNSRMMLEGNRKTQVLADIASGFLLSMKVESETEGMASMPQLGPDPVPTFIKSTITYKRLSSSYVP